MSRLVKGEKKIAGVCSGVANYIGVDATVVRLLWVFISLFYGFGILAYLIAAIVMPED